MEQAKDTGDVRRWLKDDVEGLEPGEAARARSDSEAHICDVVRARLKRIPADPTLQRGFFAELRDLIGGLSEESRADLEQLIGMHEAAAARAFEDFVMTTPMKALTLKSWLDIATKGISEAGIERIRREISAHYADALEMAREEGKSNIDAHISAMESLGNPYKAGRAFRKSYLICDEEKIIRKRIEQLSKARLVDFSPHACIALTIGMQLPRMQSGIWLFLSLFCLAATFAISVYVWCSVCPKAVREGRVHDGLAITAISAAPYAVLFIWASHKICGFPLFWALMIEFGVLLLGAVFLPKAGVGLERKWRDLQSRQSGLSGPRFL